MTPRHSPPRRHQGQAELFEVANSKSDLGPPERWQRPVALLARLAGEARKHVAETDSPFGIVTPLRGIVA